MMLENKVAIVYGGGPISGAVAHTFTREGASVFLAGRNREKIESIASEVRRNGGTIVTSIVDALVEQEINDFVDSVAAQAGRIDISFNLISYGDVQQPISTISVNDFLQPITTAMQSHFLTAQAAARHMVKAGAGVILAFGGGGPQTVPGLGGFKVALDALEGLRRQWACELGPHGIRVVTLKTGGIPETVPDDFPGREQIADSIQQATLLNWVASLDDVGKVAAFVASDHARTITSTAINISCGSIID